MKRPALVRFTILTGALAMILTAAGCNGSGAGVDAANESGAATGGGGGGGTHNTGTGGGGHGGGGGGVAGHASGGNGSGSGGTSSGSGGAGGVCSAPPQEGCCATPTACGLGRNCVGLKCDAPGATAGVCKDSLLGGGLGVCWTDADCPAPYFCSGPRVCPCGAACLVADVVGVCATHN